MFDGTICFRDKDRDCTDECMAYANGHCQVLSALISIARGSEGLGEFGRAVMAEPFGIDGHYIESGMSAIASGVSDIASAIADHD